MTPTAAGQPDALSENEIERWLFQSGLCVQSVEALRPALPRWRRQLLERGVLHIPRTPWSTDGCDTLASNMLSLLVRQAALERNAAIEHNLRDLVGVRPYKG